MIGLEDLRTFGHGLNHSEGLAWDPNAGCLYAGGEGGEFYRVTLDGEVELLASTGGWMLGIAVDGDGRVYACDHGRGRVARLDPSTAVVEDYGYGRDDPLDTPNVAAFDGSGNLFVTCSGEAGRPEIVRIDPEGVIRTWTVGVPGYPNGCVVLPDQSALLVVEAKAQRVARIPIEDDGSAGDPETFVELNDTDADGLALDGDGNLWVTLYRPDGIVRVDPTGRIDLRLDDHLATTMNAPTNIAFAGAALEQAFIANVGGHHLLAADLGVKGQPLFIPRLRA